MRCMGCPYCCTINSIIPLKKDDKILWSGMLHRNPQSIKNLLFHNLTDYALAKSIWFKIFSINHALYCWMASLERLKTSNKLRG